MKWGDHEFRGMFLCKTREWFQKFSKVHFLSLFPWNMMFFSHWNNIFKPILTFQICINCCWNFNSIESSICSDSKLFLMIFFHQLSNCRRYSIFNFFLPMKTNKIRPPKLLMIGPKFFFKHWPNIDFSCYKYVRTLICVKTISIRRPSEVK